MSAAALGEAKGMSLRTLAGLVGVSAPFMSDLEHGRRRTTKLKEIAKVLGVPLNELHRIAARVDEDLREWIEVNPGLVALLRLSRQTRRPLILKGGPQRSHRKALARKNEGGTQE